MAMNLSAAGADPDVMIDINTTPLIDVMLVLIIMLIVTLPIQLHALNLNLPAGHPPPPAAEPVVITVDIDFDGTVLWNGEIVPDPATLEARLRAVSAAADPPEVHLRPNKLVEYKSVAAVLASAQRLGVTKLGMVGHERFAN